MGYLLFLICFALYLLLMAPTIALEDSGEFATAAYTLSLTHPPGYPLYLLLGKMFTWLPVGSPPFRLALMSAASAAGAVVLIYTFIRELRPTRGPVAACCALSLAFAPALAIQAVLADKYALNLALFCAAQLFCLRAWREGGRWLAPLALVTGLALAHHMQILYLAPALAALLWHERRRLTGRRIGLLILLAALPLSLKPMALPLCARASPSLLFGQLDTVQQVRRYLSAKDYSGRFKAYTLQQKVSRFWTQGIKELGKQTGGLPGGLLLILAGLGSAWGWRRARPVLVTGAAGSAMALLLVSNFNIAGVGYYLLPVVALLCVLAGAGLAGLAQRFGTGLALAVGLLVCGNSALQGLPAADLSRYYGAVDWGRNLLRSLGPAAVLVTRHDDDFFPPMFLQRVLGERRDVVLIHRPFITRLWYHAQAERLYPGFVMVTSDLIPWGEVVTPKVFINLFVRSQLRMRELAFTYLASSETAGGFLLRPQGSVFIVGRRETEPPLPREQTFGAQLQRFRLRSAHGPYPDGSRYQEVAGAYATLWTQLALRWWERGEETEARTCLRRALRYPYTRVVRKDLERVKATMGL